MAARQYGFDDVRIIKKKQLEYRWGTQANSKLTITRSDAKTKDWRQLFQLKLYVR